TLSLHDALPISANLFSTWPRKWLTASPAIGLLRLSLFCIIGTFGRGRANPLRGQFFSRPQSTGKDSFRMSQVCFLAQQAPRQDYSHSIVLGGLELMSYTTRVTPATSLTIRVEIRSSTSPGSRTQSAVIASSDSTTLTATVSP